MVKRILAVDTSTYDVSIALLEDGAPRSSWHRPHEHPPSDRIFVVLDDLLRSEGLTVADCDAFATCVGPGSFTGLRIGIGLARGFGFSLARPVFGLDAVETRARALARAARQDLEGRDVFVVVEGWRDTTFAATFRIHGDDIERRGELGWYDGEEALAAAAPADAVIFVAPDARLAPRGAHRQPDLESPALTIARWAHARLERGDSPDDRSLQPLYLKPFNVGRRAVTPQDLRP